MQIGEMYEAESDLKNAIDNFQSAADYYLGEEQPRHPPPAARN